MVYSTRVVWRAVPGDMISHGRPWAIRRARTPPSGHSEERREELQRTTADQCQAVHHLELEEQRRMGPERERVRGMEKPLAAISGPRLITLYTH